MTNVTVENFEAMCVSRFLFTPPAMIEKQEKLISSLTGAVEFVRDGGAVADVRDRFDLNSFIPAYRDLSKVSRKNSSRGARKSQLNARRS